MIVLKQLCKVCGKEFITPKGSGVVTCEDCRGTVLKLRTFGEKQCVWCGKTFIANSPRQTSCGETHYLPCPDCGVAVEVKETYQNFMKNGGKPRRCSNCRAKAISQTHKSFSDEKKSDIKQRAIATTQLKYGADYAMQSDEIKQKAKKRVQELYGVENLGQSPEIRKKIDKTVQERYGGYTLASPVLRKQVEATNLDKYGVKNPILCKDIQEKQKRTNIERYGAENVFSSKEIQDKIKTTCLDRYDVPYAIQSEDVRDRIRNTCLQKYGCLGAPNQVFQFKSVNDPKFLENYCNFVDNPRSFIVSRYPYGVSFAELHKFLNIDGTTLSEYCNKHNLWDIVFKKYSCMEQEIEAIIKSIDTSIIVEHNNRKLISPLEVDLYLPQYKIGIECNPTYTHNSSFSTAWSDYILPYKYHQQKTEKCDNVGIRLIHIYGYQWSNRRDVVISMLRNVLHKNEFRIFARDTIVKEVSSKEAKSFLNDNHLQGATASTVRLGLYHGDRLISLMTFSKPRHSSGFKASYDSNTWELTRFCTLLNTTCIGGASKLFKYFLMHYNPSVVTSFSDRSITTGNLYSVLGFEFDSYVDPGYVWVNVNNDQFYTRVTCQKSNLPKLFNELDLDITNQTEAQIMESHGYARVYNSGLIKWIYR